MNQSTREYTRELIARHVSGRLKVAPEHTSDRVLNVMRKPPFAQFETFKKIFDRINQEEGLRQQLIPYFISSHPGCHEEDMANWPSSPSGSISTWSRCRTSRPHP